MRAYRPAVTEQKKLYSLLLSLKRSRSQKAIAPSSIKSNSEPWIAHPRSLADVITVSESVEHSVDEIRPQLNDCTRSSSLSRQGAPHSASRRSCRHSSRN